LLCANMRVSPIIVVDQKRLAGVFVTWVGSGHICHVTNHGCIIAGLKNGVIRVLAVSV
jgi:hypothetical protein